MSGSGKGERVQLLETYLFVCFFVCSFFDDIEIVEIMEFWKGKINLKASLENWYASKGWKFEYFSENRGVLLNGVLVSPRKKDENLMNISYFIYVLSFFNDTRLLK